MPERRYFVGNVTAFRSAGWQGRGRGNRWPAEPASAAVRGRGAQQQWRRQRSLQSPAGQQRPRRPVPHPPCWCGHFVHCRLQVLACMQWTLAEMRSLLLNECVVHQQLSLNITLLSPRMQARTHRHQSARCGHLPLCRACVPSSLKLPTKAQVSHLDNQRQAAMGYTAGEQRHNNLHKHLC